MIIEMHLLLKDLVYCTQRFKSFVCAFLRLILYFQNGIW